MSIIEEVGSIERSLSALNALPSNQLADPADAQRFQALLGNGMIPTPTTAPQFDASLVAPAPVPDARIDELVDANATACGIDPALVKAVIANESGFDAHATSQCGAQGLMQLMPGTAAGLGIDNAYDPVENVSAGTRYLAELLAHFGGNVPLAVAAYNAGPGAVERYGGIPPYAQTQTYVQRVLESYDRYRMNSTNRP